MGTIVSCFSNILFLSEKFTILSACACLLVCFVIMMTVSIILGMGLGYNYCFVDLKTRYIKIPGHWADPGDRSRWPPYFSPTLPPTIPSITPQYRRKISLPDSLDSQSPEDFVAGNQTQGNVTSPYDYGGDGYEGEGYGPGDDYQREGEEGSGDGIYSEGGGYRSGDYKGGNGEYEGSGYDSGGGRSGEGEYIDDENLRARRRNYPLGYYYYFDQNGQGQNLKGLSGETTPWTLITKATQQAQNQFSIESQEATYETMTSQQTSQSSQEQTKHDIGSSQITVVSLLLSQMNKYDKIHWTKMNPEETSLEVTSGQPNYQPVQSTLVLKLFSSIKLAPKTQDDTSQSQSESDQGSSADATRYYGRRGVSRSPIGRLVQLPGSDRNKGQYKARGYGRRRGGRINNVKEYGGWNDLNDYGVKVNQYGLTAVTSSAQSKPNRLISDFYNEYPTFIEHKH